MFKSISLFSILVYAPICADLTNQTAAIRTIVKNTETESVHEQLYNFVVTFQEMKPSIFNLAATWLKLQYLLQSGAQFERADIDINSVHRGTGATMLYCATRAGNLQTAHLLIAQGANPNIQDHVLGNTPLHTAAEKGYDDFITHLCTNKANPNIANHEGQTPLHKAVLYQQTASVAALLDRKVHRNITDKYGKQPIDYARARGYEAIIELLEGK